MKVASYNIMSGGFKSYNYDNVTPERLFGIQQAIREINADFIALIDTFRWDEIYSDKQLASLFEYGYAKVINLKDDRLKQLGHNNGVAVLSNIPIEKFDIVRLYSRNCLKAELKINDKIWDFFAVYLDDLMEQMRINQINALMKKISHDKPTILLGDLNCFCQKNIQAGNPGIEKFLTDNPGVSEKFIPIFNEMKKGAVHDIIIKNGFVDADGNCLSTIPTPLMGVKTSGPFEKLDYIFVNKHFSSKSFRVYRGEIFDRASDHYPISTEVELK